MTAKKNLSGSDNRFYRGAMRWMGVGIEFALVVGGCAFLGSRLDQWEGTGPGWMILGFFVGFGIMFYNMIQRAKKDEKEEEAEKAEEYKREREELEKEQDQQN